MLLEKVQSRFTFEAALTLEMLFHKPRVL